MKGISRQCIYRGMIIGVRNLHLLLTRINLNSTNLVGIKRKNLYSSFTVGRMQFKNPAFCYWHQTLWPPFSLSIEIIVNGMCFYRGCIASLSFQTIITPFREIAILLKILEFSILGYLYCIRFSFSSPRVSDLLEWTRVNVMMLYTVEMNTAQHYLKN